MYSWHWVGVGTVSVPRLRIPVRLTHPGIRRTGGGRSRERSVVGDVDQDFGGNYLNETAILRAARERGISTANGPYFEP
jgi:hypothetical protein